MLSDPFVNFYPDLDLNFGNVLSDPLANFFPDLQRALGFRNKDEAGTTKVSSSNGRGTNFRYENAGLADLARRIRVNEIRIQPTNRSTRNADIRKIGAMISY